MRIAVMGAGGTGGYFGALLAEIRSHFQDWDIPVWQQKCEQALEALENFS